MQDINNKLAALLETNEATAISHLQTIEAK